MELRRSAFGLIVSLLLAVLAIGPIGCSSVTQISSEPEGAAVRIDNIPHGKTPVSYQDGSVWIWTKHHVSVEKQGYEQAIGRIKGEFIPAYVVLGVISLFCFIPTAWVALVGEYKPRYHFVLRRKQALQSAAVEGAPSIEFAY